MAILLDPPDPLLSGEVWGTRGVTKAEEEDDGPDNEPHGSCVIRSGFQQSETTTPDWVVVVVVVVVVVLLVLLVVLLAIWVEDANSSVLKIDAMSHQDLLELDGIVIAVESWLGQRRVILRRMKRQPVWR